MNRIITGEDLRRAMLASDAEDERDAQAAAAVFAYAEIDLDGFEQFAAAFVGEMMGEVERRRDEPDALAETFRDALAIVVEVVLRAQAAAELRR